MAKYSKKIVKRICELIEADSYTVAEICSMSGIHHDTYYEWLKNKPEFADAVTRAREQFDDILVKEAKNSLRKKVSGYEVEEQRTVYIEDKKGDKKPKIKEQTRIKKHIQPDTFAIQFVLTNKAPNEYKNKVSSEVTGKDGKDLIPNYDTSKLTEEQRATLLSIGEDIINAPKG